MTQLPLVSVIIPTYNRLATLTATVGTFLRQDYPADRLEIIVADNNSSDGTREAVQRLMQDHPQIRYLFEPRQGVHFARNSAAKTARGEILYFTDDDMEADPQLLHELVRVMEMYPEVGSATGLIVPAFEKEPPSWVRRHLWNHYLSLTERDRPEEIIVSREDLVYSCHQGIRREVFFASGGFNPENTAGIWIGDGETGLNRKVKALGYRFAYTSRSMIRHVIPPQRMTLRYLMKRLGNQGFCDSYSEYRTHRRPGLLIPAMIRRSTIGAARMMSRSLLDVVLGNLSWHFIPARLCYLLNRLRYDLRLLRDHDFRTMVEVDDWLEKE